MSSRSSTPTPMLPPMRASRPASRQTWPTSAVVVDLPLVPVMATILGLRCSGAAFTARAKSSMSPTISTPAARAFSTVQCGAGWVSGTPGDSIRAANPLQSAVLRSTSGKPAAAAASREAGFSSHSATCAPPATSARAAARPVRARPNTATVLPSKPRTGIMAWLSPPLPELQGGQAQQGQHDRDDPEADHDGRFRPAELLEMVVDRGHQEYPAAGPLEPGHLDDHRQGLRHEEAADDAQHDLLARRHGRGPDAAAQRQRAGVAHEDPGGRGVVPEEAETGADHRAAVDGDLADARDEVELQ